eukprot:PITA_33302
MIEEEVYIEQLEGFEMLDCESHVCRLKRELYGLKQAPRAWYTRIDSYFIGLGFKKSEADANLYHIMVEGKILIIIIYVDDLIITSDEKFIKSCKEELAIEFDMKTMELIYYFLGMEVWQGDGELFASQRKYANEILRRFRMDSSEPRETPLTVNQLSQAMVRPTKLYWKAEKHVLRYLRGTTQFELWYIRTEGVKLQGFTDVDWAGSPSDRKSTSGGIFSIGSTVVSWYNRKQRSVELSSVEAEYMESSSM